jgi:D-alanyl-D-alanine carboxypeptidase
MQVTYMTRKKARIIVGLFSLVLLAGLGVSLYVITKHQLDKPKAVVQQAPTPASGEPTLFTFDKNRYPTDKPESPWVVVNKKRPLLADYVPADLKDIRGAQLQSLAATDLEQLFAAAARDRIALRPISGYRSYETQHALYNDYVKKDGAAKADTFSARPGYSEHQTGLAVDIGNGSGQCDLDICFATTAGGQWLAANAHTYGFTIRYQEDKTAITGYQYEPWHVRYVGVDLANELRSKKQTMEEFFNLPAAPGY